MNYTYETFNNPGPMEPSSDIRTFANTMRQMFMALTLEGFSEAEALTFVGQAIASMFGSRQQ